MQSFLLFAAASVPAPEGRTSPWAVAVILLLLAGGIAFALFRAVVHARGKGGDCRDGGAEEPSERD